MFLRLLLTYLDMHNNRVWLLINLNIFNSLYSSKINKLMFILQDKPDYKKRKVEATVGSRRKRTTMERRMGRGEKRKEELKKLGDISSGWKIVDIILDV